MLKLNVGVELDIYILVDELLYPSLSTLFV